MFRKKSIERLKSGGFFGEDQMVHKSAHIFKYLVQKDAVIYFIPLDEVIDIPIIQCKLLETYQRRIGLSEMDHLIG